LLQFGIGVQGKRGLEHRGVVGGLGAREDEVGLAKVLESGERVWSAVVPGLGERRLEALEAADRHVHHELVAVAEMAIGCRLDDPRRARGLGEGEAERALGRDQLQRRVDQRLLEVAVMVAPAPTPAIRPSHVIGFYMSRGRGAAGMWSARTR